MDLLLKGIKAAADPTRLRILALCAQGDFSVGDLTWILSQSQPRVSRHLKLLSDAGLLERMPEGTSTFFRLAERGTGANLAGGVIELMPRHDAMLVQDLARADQVKADRAAAARAYFDEIAGEWDRLRAMHVSDREVEEALLAMLPPAPVGALADLGTGTGRMLQIMAPRADRLVGVDLSRPMLAVARANLAQAGCANCQVRQGDLYRLPLGDGLFDVAVLHQVLHFLDEPLAALREAVRILRPGGRLLIADFARHGLLELQNRYAHRWLGFSDSQVAGWLARAGCRIDRMQQLPGAPLTVNLWAADLRETGDGPD